MNKELKEMLENNKPKIENMSEQEKIYTKQAWVYCQYLYQKIF